MNRILMVIMAAGVIVGGIDRILGNKWGYGAKFEEGFQYLGSTALSMTGMICLAPVLADFLGKAVVPFYGMIGVDPGMFGSLLAIDMGGYQLAKELADDALIGSYAGIVAASIFGCTIVFTIPVGMGMIREADRGCFAKGTMIGLVTIPVGLTTGGMIAGLPMSVCIWQNLPVFVLALLLLLGLWKIPDRMIRGFCIFAKGIRAVITVGLVLGAVDYLCGLNVLKGMTPVMEAMEIVAAIGIVMLGSLPVVEFLKRILQKPFQKLGKCVGINNAGMTGLLVGAVSAIPAISMYQDMDERGKIVNAAFLVSAASMLSAHMGFTLSTEPEFLGALIGAKLSGGAAAVAMALVMSGRGKIKHKDGYYYE